MVKAETWDEMGRRIRAQQLLEGGGDACEGGGGGGMALL